MLDVSHKYVISKKREKKNVEILTKNLVLISLSV